MVRMTQKPCLEGQVYSVPLIQPDLRREEAIHQISVGQNRRQLQSVTERIQLARARVDKIKGSKKATKVFSSAKYPAPDRLQDYTSIFSGATDPSSQSRPRYRIQNKLRALDDKALQYVLLDPLAGAVTKTHNALETEKEEKPFDAPLSITKREQLERQTKESYFYVPNLGQVPEINVPSYLPDLPGIADDLSYSADLGPGIAPSSVPGCGSTSAAPSSSATPSPSRVCTSPTGSPWTSPSPSSSSSASSPSSSSSHFPTHRRRCRPVPAAPIAVVQQSSGRANLLESIRNAGGIGKAKLRDVKDRKMEKRKQKEQEQAVGAAASGGDFMSDLFNKLSMRISGKGPAGGDSADTPLGTSGAFARMSDVIPPLPAPQPIPGDDEDWEA
ncbi:hypothetical protein CRUP_013610 [Coryphaenoides rupestris]|nr:hypothetical protein CRUP_013610 [Coryphaenoides rupestris]